ncbi:hypothetical protein K438DRAFT_1749292 [Mycena galopus ATCC 62051]|nr:hypothetical protein K438DRAFT_1749292 [Mycena galopus ATCC 62051]
MPHVRATVRQIQRPISSALGCCRPPFKLLPDRVHPEPKDSDRKKYQYLGQQRVEGCCAPGVTRWCLSNPLRRQWILLDGREVSHTYLYLRRKQSKLARFMADSGRIQGLQEPQNCCGRGTSRMTLDAMRHEGPVAGFSRGVHRGVILHDPVEADRRAAKDAQRIRGRSLDGGGAHRQSTKQAVDTYRRRDSAYMSASVPPMRETHCALDIWLWLVFFPNGDVLVGDGIIPAALKAAVLHKSPGRRWRTKWWAGLRFYAFPKTLPPANSSITPQNDVFSWESSHTGTAVTASREMRGKD